MGGIPVDRNGRGGSVTAQVVERFNESAQLTIAITPEGTRKRTSRWHSGFLHIARLAGAKIVLGVIDAENKRIIIKDTFTPSGDVDADILAIKKYYRNFKGVNPDKFSAE